MKTDELITILANGDVAVAPGTVKRRFVIALGLSVPVCLTLMMATMGMSPDIATAVQLPIFWIKLIFTITFSSSALVLVERLSCPGAALGRLPIALIILLIVVLMIAALAGVPFAERDGLIFGQTRAACPAAIAALSIPVIIAVFWAMRGLAPTRPRLAGAVAGSLAGSVAAAIFTLHCTEMAAPLFGGCFVYGMLIPAGVGAAVGPWVLSW